MNTRGKTLAAVLTGTVAGAALGTLLAPDKGSKTRARIARSATKLSESFKERKESGLKSLDKIKSRIVAKTGSVGRRKNGAHKMVTRTARRAKRQA